MNKANFLIHNINKVIAKSLQYKGIVVDLGCGTAPYKNEILNFAEKYIGIDWQNTYHEKSNIDIIADLCKPLPIKNNSIDTAISFQVIEHLSEPFFFLLECFRILKPGGNLFITSPFMWHIHEEPYDFFRYTKYGLEYLLAKAGFINITIRENTGFWQMWILKFNYHSIRFARGPLKLLLTPIWCIGQIISPFLDKIDKNSNETASYTALAKKPNVT